MLPSNEGRGYVLRRIMRRAMRHAAAARRQRAADVAARAGAGARDGPGLSRAGARRAADRRDAEARGDALPHDARARPALLDEETATLEQGDALAGEVAFKLYDTYGFPLDLTQDALRRAASASTSTRFDAAMERQREEARARWAGSGEAATETVWFELREKLGATEFLGYDTETAEGVVPAHRRATARRSTRLEGRRDRRGGRSTRRRSTASPAARSATPA